ncbi:hypothetical protein [Rhizobium sp. Rhizsp42]|uniref:hypothetical protein n=1 Tax=Rhizobium sp. Rhizsp42 TaxID=3243034 RepID=UPI0039AFAA43
MTDLADDLTSMAVIDAFKWWVNNDFEFLQRTEVLDATGQRTDNEVGRMDLSTFRDIADAYGVSRNVPGSPKDDVAGKILKKLSSPEMSASLLGSMCARKDKLVEFTRANAISVIYKETGRSVNRELASALSKITWFLRPEDWTVFDRYVGVAVLRRIGSGTMQMESFYDRLAPDFKEVSAAVSKAVVRHGFHPFLTNRIIDKFLFCHGLGMFDKKLRSHGKMTDSFVRASTQNDKLQRTSVKLHRSSLVASKLALGKHVSERLDGLAEEIRPILSAVSWTEPTPALGGR